MIESQDCNDIIITGWCFWIDWWDWAFPLHLTLEPENECLYVHLLFLNIAIWRRTHGNGVDTRTWEMEGIQSS